MDWCLIAAGWSDPSMWFAGLEVALGLGFVIFVHELGHFAVAKMCGVKVEKFFIGFDIFGLKLFSFRWGETLYGIGALPLGGYVKMLGQEDNPAQLRKEMERARQAEATGAPSSPSTNGNSTSDDLAFDPRSYPAKSVPQRIAIISAGVIMNMIFALVLAVIAFFLGVRLHTCEVGQVMAGGAAWQSDFRSGDVVREVAGNKVRSFRRMTEEIVTGDVDHGVPIVVERPGVKEPLEIILKPQMMSGRPAIGVGSASELKLRNEKNILPFLPESAAAKADPPFLPGDRIVEIDGEPMKTFAQLEDYLTVHSDTPLKVAVERTKKLGEKAEVATITVPASPMRQFGIAMTIGPVAAVQANSPAAKADIKPGDLLKSIDGKAIEDPMTLPDKLHSLAGKELTLVLEREGKPLEIKVTLLPKSRYAPSEIPDCPVAISELGLAYYVANTVKSVEPNGPAAKAGLQAGDEIVLAKIVPPPKDEIQKLQAKYPDSEMGQNEIALDFGATARNWPLFMYALQSGNPGTTVEFKWRRAKDEMTAKLTPVAATNWFESQRGWGLEPAMVVQRTDNFREALSMGAHETSNATLMVYRSLHSMTKGNISLRNLGGPWTIILAALHEARLGVGNLFLFLTLLSANLAVINFLPIPVLDGGHLVLLLYEGIRGKPADERVQEILTYVGLIFILSLMVFVFGLDFGWISRPGAH